jgi:hypothetical protein
MYSAYGSNYKNYENELIETLAEKGYLAIDFIKNNLKVDLQDVF